ncbi:MAG: hypothetical protein EU529_04030 [Promethearchaeota archaeon]|nr:MAG: hypothetical protein EU529_04030 [Candidatus Lokiarchaeota archaeon]
MTDIKQYTQPQKLIGTIIYVSFVISFIMIIGSAIWALLDVIMARGKTELFLRLSLGFQIAIIGGILAALFFLLILFYGLFRRGVTVILNIIFRPIELEEKFKNRKTVKLAAGALMVSLFAIIVGIVISIFYEIFRAIAGGTEVSIAGIAENLSGGQIALIISILVLIITILTLALFYMWFNGYGLIIRLLYTLEEEEEGK